MNETSTLTETATEQDATSLYIDVPHQDEILTFSCIPIGGWSLHGLLYNVQTAGLELPTFSELVSLLLAAEEHNFPQDDAKDSLAALTQLADELIAPDTNISYPIPDYQKLLTAYLAALEDNFPDMDHNNDPNRLSHLAHAMVQAAYHTRDSSVFLTNTGVLYQKDRTYFKDHPSIAITKCTDCGQGSRITIMDPSDLQEKLWPDNTIRRYKGNLVTEEVRELVRSTTIKKGNDERSIAVAGSEGARNLARLIRKSDKGYAQISIEKDNPTPTLVSLSTAFEHVQGLEIRAHLVYSGFYHCKAFGIKQRRKAP